MESKFGADVGPSLAALDALTASTLSSFLEKNELASAKVCERIELDCERVMEREASQPIPSKGKFRKRYQECTERFRQACVGPAKHRNQERLEHAWEREVARFDKEFNDRLLNGVVFLTIAWVVVFRFIVRIAIAETIGWIAFVFLQVYPRTFIGSGTSVYETDWWQVRLSNAVWVIPNPLARGPLGLPFDIYLSRPTRSHHRSNARTSGLGQGVGGRHRQWAGRPRHPDVHRRCRLGGILLPRPVTEMFLLLLPAPDPTRQDPRDKGPRRLGPLELGCVETNRLHCCSPLL